MVALIVLFHHSLNRDLLIDTHDIFVILLKRFKEKCPKTIFIFIKNIQFILIYNILLYIA